MELCRGGDIIKAMKSNPSNERTVRFKSPPHALLCLWPFRVFRKCVPSGESYLLQGIDLLRRRIWDTGCLEGKRNLGGVFRHACTADVIERGCCSCAAGLHHPGSAASGGALPCSEVPASRHQARCAEPCSLRVAMCTSSLAVSTHVFCLAPGLLPQPLQCIDKFGSFDKLKHSSFMAAQRTFCCRRLGSGAT